MFGIDINEWLIDNTRLKAALLMGISPQAVYKMIESGRNIRVVEEEFGTVFYEIKELNR